MKLTFIDSSFRNALFFLLIFLFTISNVNAQSSLNAGDVAIVAVNSTNPDKFTMVFLKDVVANTVINFTDNGFATSTNTRTGEGFLTYTVPVGGHAAGTLITWTNGMSITGTGWSSNNPSNFALNTGGDQLIIFTGLVSNWSTLNGITILYGLNFGTDTSSVSSAVNTVQPAATILPSTAWLNLNASIFSNTYFANASSATTNVSLNDAPYPLLSNLISPTKWYGNSTTAAIFPTYNITVVCSNPNAPTVTNAARCGTGVVTLVALSGVDETVDWYNAISGGNVQSFGYGTTSFTTPSLSASTTFYAETRNLTTGCVSTTRTAALAIVSPLSVGGTVTSDYSFLCQSGSANLVLSGYTGSIQWQRASDNVNFTNISGQTSSSFSTGNTTSTTYYRVVVTSGICPSTFSNTAIVTVNNPQVVSVYPDSTCLGGAVTLSAIPSNGAIINWFTNATGGTSLATNNTYSVPNLNTSKTFYAEARISNSYTSLGNIAQPTNTGATSERGIVFTTTAPGKIISAQYYSPTINVTNTVVAFLYNATGTLLKTVTLSIPQGATAAWYTMNLNFEIEANTTYRLTATFTSSVNRISSGANYALSSFTNLTPLGTITSGFEGGTVSASAYNYFHNISVEVYCNSVRSPVTASVKQAPSIFPSASNALICNGAATNLSVNSTNAGYSYTWSNGLGTGASVTASPTATTTYTVTATDNSGGANNGCTTTAPLTITVNPVPSAVSLTPNSTQNLCAGNIQSIMASGGILSTNFNIGPLSPISQGGSISASAFSIGTYYQQFDVLQATTLVSIDVYPTAAVGTTGSISIANSAGTILTTANYTVANSSGTVPQTVTLNYPLSIGTGYRIGQGGTAINLNRNTTNQVYPVAISTLSITGNSLSNNSWMYTYNWKVNNSTQQPITWSPTTDLYTNAAATTAYTGNPSTVYSKPTANRTYTATATTSNGCTSSASVTINYSGTPLATAPSNGAYVFGATSNTNYNTAANWYTYSSTNGYSIASAVPTSSDVVVIPASGTCVNAQPSLSANATITDVEIQSGAILSLNGNTLSIAGALTGAGTIKGSATSSLSFTGTSNNTLKMDQTTAGTTNVLKNLTLSGTGTTTLGNALNITAGANSGSVTAGAGTTLTTGGFLRLKSDASGTARIAQSAGTISGNVTQERYVPGKAIRRWSFLASPVTQSLASAWQQQIHITGAGTGGTMCNNYTISGTMTPHTNGFDVTQLQNPSFYTYDAATDNFVANTTGTTNYTLTPGVGYMVLVRGDRNDATNGGCVLLSANNQAAFTSTPVTLAATGAVGQGTITKVLPAGYSFIGNPYPCEIDFPSFNTTNASVISGGYWTYYPTNATYTFSTYNNGTSTNGGTQVIANGQSFLVNSTSGGTITFNEAHKSTTANNGNFRLTKTWDELIRVGLSNNQGARYDEVVVRFGNDAAITKALNEYDAASVNGGDQWIKTLKDANELAIQTRPNAYQNDTVSLAMHAKNAGTYQLNFSEYQGLSNTEVYLIDQQENLIQNVKALPSYEFSVGANTTTANRFKLIFDAKTSGVAALATKTALQVYPNPTKDKVRITCDGLAYGAYQIKVRTITGAEVLKAKGTYYQNEVIELSLQDLAAGMYMLELTQDNGLRAIQKITKQ